MTPTHEDTVFSRRQSFLGYNGYRVAFGVGNYINIEEVFILAIQPVMTQAWRPGAVGRVDELRYQSVRIYGGMQGRFFSREGIRFYIFPETKILHVGAKKLRPNPFSIS